MANTTALAKTSAASIATKAMILPRTVTGELIRLRQPYEPQGERGGASNRKNHDEWRRHLLEDAGGAQNCAGSRGDGDSYQRADHPRRKIGSQNVSRRRAIAPCETYERGEEEGIARTAVGPNETRACSIRVVGYRNTFTRAGTVLHRY